MRMGVFGGTFDPIHYGHLQMAEACREHAGLDEVRFIPAGTPPHKTDQPVTDAHARADMVRLAVSGCPDFPVDRREIRRDGPSYTVDTLKSLKEDFPEAELFLIIGADSLADFSTWRAPEEIAELATLLAVNRPGCPAPSSLAALTKSTLPANARIDTVSMPGADLSSSDLRERIRSGRSIRFLTPRAVEAFLTEHRLYNDSSLGS